MEEMRGAAMAYYAKMSEVQRQSFEKFKSLIDGNGDGKVSFEEYFDYISIQGYNHLPWNLFQLLDENSRGYLDFEECVTLFYMITCNRFVFCGGNDCKSPLLLGLHFVCVECYRATMKDLVKTAELYYQKSSSDIKTAAWDFFMSLDNNNDGKVSLHEFLGFMCDKGHVKMGTSQFFKELDNDNNGTLEFMEVMALYYIIKSGRPFCGGCAEFIPGMYFTCSVCFDNGNDLFCPSSSVTITQEPTSTTNAVVLYEPKTRTSDHVYSLLEVAIGTAVGNLCTIL
ncbi:hypothetical protein RHGRI_003684 [Rhododendron griersonianum]|uniref:EF-hand domain-containing protein n=1 Tax=Rhododendron griersonianum TaxID=479676 RepID=A0AAV6L738_9ERIC|nr:hypothetical protein RHGRI_003684 [Rhododendron griersonianum]